MSDTRIVDKDELFEYVEVQPGVVLAAAAKSLKVNSNAAIIDLGGRLVVVDTHARPSAAKAVIGFINRWFDVPVGYVVDSHYHWDHCQGNEAYRDAWPEAALVAHARSREVLVREGDRIVREQIEGLPAALAELSGQMAAAETPEERHRLTSQIEELEGYGDELSRLRPTIPELSVTHDLTVHGDRREVRLLHPGRAHTAGDLCAHLPEEGILVTGDVVIGWIPYLGDGYPSEWVAALRGLEALHVETLMLGHGRPEGRAWLELFRRYFEDLLTETEATVRAELGVDEAGVEVRRKLAPRYEEPFTRQVGDYRPWASLVLANVQRTYQELSGG